ncbi:Cobalamin-independent synthase, Catalytic domain [Haloechinothrix alba]|uniref:Cobalamin-independent synthase, Catalytic domain n=1 Tax=Haloechinothrix alba TaxID=664784 RepID=A0A238VM29_9PSEU|nr:methionine synthase [Haloechinothrix alba]SNR35286.1 Cobalamin-independent synthase, Catalytic domain [Haloechinothrix alba]
MQDFPWPVGAATALGPMPGSDITTSAELVLGELPEFPHVPDLPERGVGADPIGRTAALLTDLAVEVAPTGYRVAARPGRHHKRGVDLVHRDMDGLEHAAERDGTRDGLLKTQVAGPWTLTASIELARGHRVLTDHGALRDFTGALVDGVGKHVTELAQRTGRRVVVQLDEPLLPEVLAGSLSTPSGYGTVPSVPEPEVKAVLAPVVEQLEHATGSPVVLRCGVPRPPVGVLRGTGAQVLSLDATQLAGAPGRLLDEIGEAWEEGTVLLLGLVPDTAPAERVDLRGLAEPALWLVDRLGFNRSILAERAVPTPVRGLADADESWVRRALSLTRDLGKAFVEPPQGW